MAIVGVNVEHDHDSFARMLAETPLHLKVLALRAIMLLLLVQTTTGLAHQLNHPNDAPDCLQLSCQARQLTEAHRVLCDSVIQQLQHTGQVSVKWDPPIAWLTARNASAAYQSSPLPSRAS